MPKPCFLQQQLKYVFISISFSFIFSVNTFAYSVTYLKALYRNGQVFVIWASPPVTNLQYNLYRSSQPIFSSSDLSQATLMGFVRDSSSKNIRQSILRHTPTYFKIVGNAKPLNPNSGLYVVTCTDNNTHYYAVTVTDLGNSMEDKTIYFGRNSLNYGVHETVADPQPVWQDSTLWNNTFSLGLDHVQNYVWFGNNQNQPNLPAMLNCGFYGFNFYIIKRGNTNKAPLYVFYEGLLANSLVGNGLGAFGSMTNCYIIGLDNWLPSPDANSGRKIYWCGYHENFNFYNSDNPIPTTGTVRTYSQAQYIHTIDWANKYLSDDPSRVYVVGVSAGGFGALLTAMIVPQKIAAVYAIVPPVVIKSESEDIESEEMWGASNSNLPSDIVDPSTGKPIKIFDLMNIKSMFGINQKIGVPVIYSVSGKNDVTVGWKDKPAYFNSAETNHQGGVFFWDQRAHDGTGADFSDSETTPKFCQYQTTKSYPAFSNASSDENPGDGDSSDGDPYGAYNGYLTWDSTIVDEPCTWSANLLVKEFTVDGIPDAKQYKSVTADVTLRRLQSFKPSDKAIISWTNWDMKTNKSVASGSFTLKGDILTIPALSIKKAGSLLTVTLGNCSRNQNDPGDAGNFIDRTTLSIIGAGEGCRAHIQSNVEGAANFRVYDLLGRLVYQQKISLVRGTLEFLFPLKQSGIYVATLRGASISISQKWFY